MVTESLSERMRRRISDHTAVIGIIGMGYVGLPLALTFSEKGFRVLGFDVDRSKIDALQLGESYIKHLEGERLKAARASGRLAATAEFARLSETDAILICVPTPLTPQREPDMSYVAGTAKQIAPYLRAGQLVVLESSTYPGTTDELVRELLEVSGLKSGLEVGPAGGPPQLVAPPQPIGHQLTSGGLSPGRNRMAQFRHQTADRIGRGLGRPAGGR